MGDRIALLKDGRLKQSGRAEELYLQPSDLFVAGFFSELNVFETRAERRRRRHAGRQGRGGRRADGTPVDVAIRTSGFDVSETCRRGGGADSFAALSRRRRIARTGRFRRRNAGPGACKVRRFVRSGARHLAFAQKV